MTDVQVAAGALLAFSGVIARALRSAVNRIVASHDRSTHALIQHARSEATTQAMLANTQAALAAFERQLRDMMPPQARPSSRASESSRSGEVERTKQRRTAPRGLQRLKEEDE